MTTFRTMIGVAVISLAALVHAAPAIAQEPVEMPQAVVPYTAGTWTTGPIWWKSGLTTYKGYTLPVDFEEKVQMPGGIIARMEGRGTGKFIYRGAIPTEHGLMAQFALVCLGHGGAVAESMLVPQGTTAPLSLGCMAASDHSVPLELSVGSIAQDGAAEIKAVIGK